MKKILITIFVLAILLSACGEATPTSNSDAWRAVCYSGSKNVLVIERAKRGYRSDGYIHLIDLDSGRKYFVQGTACVLTALENE